MTNGSETDFQPPAESTQVDQAHEVDTSDQQREEAYRQSKIAGVVAEGMAAVRQAQKEGRNPTEAAIEHMATRVVDLEARLQEQQEQISILYIALVHNEAIKPGDVRSAREELNKISVDTDEEVVEVELSEPAAEPETGTPSVTPEPVQKPIEPVIQPAAEVVTPLTPKPPTAEPETVAPPAAPAVEPMPSEAPASPEPVAAKPVLPTPLPVDQLPPDFWDDLVDPIHAPYTPNAEVVTVNKPDSQPPTTITQPPETKKAELVGQLQSMRARVNRLFAPIRDSSIMQRLGSDFSNATRGYSEEPETTPADDVEPPTVLPFTPTEEPKPTKPKARHPLDQE